MSLPDTFRPPLWREPWVFLMILFACAAGLYLWFSGWQERARAQEPDIVYGTIEGTGPGYSRYGGGRTRLRVRLESGRVASFDYALKDVRGCKRGSTVALEQRGTSLVLARKACPFAADQTGETD